MAKPDDDADPPSLASRVWIGTLVAAVGVLGMIDSFTSMIRSKAFGESNYIVTLYNAILQTAVYLAAYAALTARGCLPAGQLTSLFRSDGWRWRQLGLARLLLVAAMADVADQVTGFTAQGYLSTLAYALSNQASVPFTVLASCLVLRTRYTPLELLCVLVVVGGAVGAVALHSRDEPIDVKWAVFAALTTSFAAFSYVLKEKVFREYAPSAAPLLPRRGGGERLSFVTVGLVVNGIGLLTCLPILMVNTQLVQLGLHANQTGFAQALACLGECEHAAAAFAAYAAADLLWNASLLLLTSHGSALLAFLALKLKVPLIALFDGLDWPLLGSQPTSSKQWLALAVMGLGIAGYQWATHRKLRRLATSPLASLSSLSPLPLLPTSEEQTDEAVAEDHSSATRQAIDQQAR
ncbi:hypothetical protein AB1Y20_021108 [Prymnesium parvum]|uniref:EamA domain-containing protein n=1 Tax=Prymnesium parvum TaxID=97485 RepID=A0AB34JHS6_PRYPA